MLQTATNEVRLTDYLDAFLAALAGQLAEDKQRWGNTWQQRPRLGQEGRAFARFQDYQDQFRNAGVAVPWLKVAGEALIAFVRENHPEVLGDQADPADLSAFLPEFGAALHAQLVSDAERWGNTWQKRPRAGQEERVFARYRDYREQYENAAIPVPWLKVAGEALIAWLRETYPELIQAEAE